MDIVKSMSGTTRKIEVPVTEITLSLSYQFEALVGVLERKGVLSRVEILEEIQTMIVTRISDQSTKL